jgi:hypothetical protein
MNSLVTRNDTIYAWIAELTSKPDGNFEYLNVNYFKMKVFSVISK